MHLVVLISLLLLWSTTAILIICACLLAQLSLSPCSAQAHHIAGSRSRAFLTSSDHGDEILPPGSHVAGCSLQLCQPRFILPLPAPHLCRYGCARIFVPVIVAPALQANTHQTSPSVRVVNCAERASSTRQMLCTMVDCGVVLCRSDPFLMLPIA